MAFPLPGDQFPTPEWAPAFEQYERNNAWFSDDQIELQRVYADTSTGTTRGDNAATHYNTADGTKRKGGVRGFLSRFFNGKMVEPTESRTRIHAPIAGNIANLSADLLLSEPAVFRVVGDDGENVKGDIQTRTDRILNSEDTHRTLIHAAELTAGLSAVVLTAHWDRENTDRPWIQVTPCDAAIPEFVGNRLAAVNLYTATNILRASSEVIDHVAVHIERHEPGRIIHAVVKTDTTGRIVGFANVAEYEATADYALIPGSVPFPEVEGAIALPTGIKSITAQWWRNKPTKTFRRTLPHMGRADIEGSEQLLDAIDEVWSSWMRDIKIGRARLIIPETFLDLQGPGLGGAFDDDREILTALQFTSLDANENKISAHQFAIRAADHYATLTGLTKEIVQAAGYSLSSYGEQQAGGTGATATEVTDRTTMTERTRDKKFLYFAQAMNPLARALLELDAAHYGGKTLGATQDIKITIPPLSQMDPEKEARVFQSLRAAMAASTETLVRMRDDQLDDAQVKQEVIRIQRENGISDEEPPTDPAQVGRVDPDAPEEDPANPGFDVDGNPMPEAKPEPDPIEEEAP